MKSPANLFLNKLIVSNISVNVAILKIILKIEII